MPMLSRGRYTAHIATRDTDVTRAQQLRHLCFFTSRGLAPAPDALDADRFDDPCRHVLIHDTATEELICCFRILDLPDGRAIGQSYSAQFYDLTALQEFSGRMLEMGRFCIHPDHRDPDILRLAWAVMTRIVDMQGVKMIIGCSSFNGTAAERYRDTFAHLARHHAAPERWRPGVKAPEVLRLSAAPDPDARMAMRRMPPLLRSYLTMGGWVSDHAVIDRDLNSLHVFTGLEIAAIPASRARLLRATAG